MTVRDDESVLKKVNVSWKQNEEGIGYFLGNEDIRIPRVYVLKTMGILVLMLRLIGNTEIKRSVRLKVLYSK